MRGYEMNYIFHTEYIEKSTREQRLESNVLHLDLNRKSVIDYECVSLISATSNENSTVHCTIHLESKFMLQYE